jgi:hypothetical protein
LTQHLIDGREYLATMPERHADVLEVLVCQVAEYFRHTSPADKPAACSFSTLMICSSVNLLLRMSVSHEERTLPKIAGV